MKKLIFTFLLTSLTAFVFGQSITLDPKSTSPAGLQVTSDFALRKQKRETINGGWPNYPRDNSSVVIFEGGGSLNGMADGQDGVVVYVFNGYPTGATTTGELLIQHENTSSLAANRIMTPNGADFPVGKGGVALIYDGIKQRWRVATPEQTGGGGSFSGWGLTGNGGTNPATQFIGTTDAQGFTVKTNNLERISIESGGDVGIGITTADSKLHVAKGSAGTVTAFGSSIATLENSSSAYLSLLTPATSEAGLIFGSPTSNLRGYLVYSHSNDKMSFATNNSSKMVIESTGNVGIGTTSVATGVKFHLDNGASGVTPNSGGTFSPTLFMERNGHNYLEIASPDANERGVIFSNPTDGNSGGIYYSSKNMYFRSNSNNTRMTILANGNVGIGTATPTARLDIEGDIVVKKASTSTVGTFNALDRVGSSHFKFNGIGTITLNGIAGGQDGMILFLSTGGSATLNIQNLNGSATAANQIATNTGGTITISGRGGATLIYDSDGPFWRIVGLAN